MFMLTISTLVLLNMNYGFKQ